jgi:hypothetical protein
LQRSGNPAKPAPPFASLLGFRLRFNPACVTTHYSHHPVIPAQAGIQGLSVLFNTQLKPNINPNVLGFPLARE